MFLSINTQQAQTYNTVKHTVFYKNCQKSNFLQNVEFRKISLSDCLCNFFENVKLVIFPNTHIKIYQIFVVWGETAILESKSPKSRLFLYKFHRDNSRGGR